ncbi:MAG TPA: nickel-type superoxide dismutase maturation protease [Acidimicrobiales bacterium]|nr:nickel-type superoxide dismutase maturation protease [Acidimicrobiales bacterium]
MSHARYLPLRLVAVEGSSMVPTLLPGDRLLVLGLAPRVADVVAVEHDGTTMVKRVAAVDGDAITVHGDNADASTDSRTFGPVPRSSILGRAVYRYAPRERAGRIPLGP